MVAINNLSSEKINQSLLEKITKIVFKKEGRVGVDLSIALVNPLEIKKLNKKYRGQDSVTDVLSFLNKNDIIKTTEVEEDFIGEIILCPQRIKKNAQEFGKEFEEELSWALIHGILHLLGYNHKKEDEAEEMRKKEKHYLNFLK